jgi:hypothetical protein
MHNSIKEISTLFKVFYIWKRENIVVNLPDSFLESDNPKTTTPFVDIGYSSTLVTTKIYKTQRVR